MADVNAKIVVDVETAKAQAQLRALQTQVAALNKSMTASAMAAGVGFEGANKRVLQVASSVSVLDKALAGAGRSAKNSFATASQAIRGQGDALELAKRRATSLNSQYQQIGKSVGGLTTFNKTLGTTATTAQITAQRMVILNRALVQGSTAMLNYGKNLQWAGRQLMVGFTVPLTILGGLAAKTFMDMERQLVNFKRVYGDFDTMQADTKAMTEKIEEQAISFAKWGITVRDSIELAASAAATGLTGDDLLATTENATRLATLGMISQEQALTTMISLNSAFQIQGQELEDTVNFLNAVENQTVLALSDVTEAIPLVAPVIKGLGGDIQDLAVMLTAMREGGIGANEAANALKTSLARLVTPAKAARDRAEELGINLKAIVEDNEGDLMSMIMDLSRAMQGLGDLQKQQLLSDLFGKRQFARMGALFTNIADEASQAQRVIDLTAESTANLAALADKELKDIEDSTGMRFTKAMEELKVAIAPVGKAFLEILTPIIETGTKIARWFDGLSDGAKTVTTYIAGIAGVLVPVGVMLLGLSINFASFVVKTIAALQGLLTKTQTTASSMEYLSLEQLEAAQAAATLDAAEDNLTATLNAQATAVANLGKQYASMNSQRRAPAAAAPGPAPVKMATGGNVPGVGNTDKIPAMLTPGEFVVKKDQANKHRGFLTALNSGAVKGFSEGSAKFDAGTVLAGAGYRTGASNVAKLEETIQRLSQHLGGLDNAVDAVTTSLSQAQAEGLTATQAQEKARRDTEGKGSKALWDEEGIAKTQSTHVKRQEEYTDDFTRLTKLEEEGRLKLSQAAKDQVEITEDVNAWMRKNRPDDKPFGVASTFTNQTYQGEEYLNSALANNGLSPQDVQASLMRTEDFGMSVIEKQLEGMQIPDLGAAEIEAGSQAMQQALVETAAEYDENTRIVDDANSDVAKRLKESGYEIVEFGEVWDRAEAKIQPQNEAFVREQKKLNEQIAVVRARYNKLDAAVLQQIEKEAGIAISYGDNGRVTARRNSDGRGFTSSGTSSAKKMPGVLRIPGTAQPYMGIATKITSDLRDEGLADAQGYLEGRQTGLEGTDPYPEGTNRNSPHPQAPIDGKDDGEAYEAARRAALEGSDPYVEQPIEKKPVKQAGGMAASPNQSNQKIVQLQRQREKSTQQVVQTNQKVVKATNKQVAQQAGLSKSFGAINAQMAARAQEEQKARATTAQATTAQQGLTQSFTAIQATLRQRQAAEQRAVTATNQQIAAQSRFTVVTNAATKAMQKSVVGIKKFGSSLMKGSMKLSASMGAATGGLFALSMFGDNESGIGKLADQIMPAAFGLMAVQQLLPLLKNPWVALIAAVVALGAGLWYLTKMSRDAISASEEYASALYGSAEELEGFAKFTGNITNASKDLQRKIEEAGTKLDEETLSEASSYLESDPGKKFLEDIEKVVDTDGTDRAAQAVVDKLTRGVLSGALSADLAKAISAEVGSALGNQSLGIDATAEITRILGPDGEPDIEGRLQLYADIQGRIVNVDESLNSANELWNDTGTLGKIGMTISGVGESDLAAGVAAGKYAEAATINAEAQAAFNQSIVDGELDAKNYNQVLSNLYATELTGAEYFNKTKDAIDQKFGKGTFDKNEYNAFLEGLKNSTERVFVMSDAVGAGGEAGKDYFEAFFGAADAVEAIDLSDIDYDGMGVVRRGSVDTSDYKEMVRLMEEQREIAQDVDMDPDVRRNARLQVERLEKDIEDYINLTSALQDGSFEIIDGETFNSAMDRFKRINGELSNLDRWLQSEIDPGSTLYSKLFGENASDGSRQGSEALEALKARVGEAQVAAMQAGVQIESVFEMLDGDIEKSIKYLEEYAFIQSEAFDELSKKEKKEFLLEMVTDTGLFDEDLMREFKNLSPSLQKEWILNITTRYSEIGKRPIGMSEYAWNAMSNAEQKKWFAESQKPESPGPNPADRPTGSNSGSSGGGEEDLDWLEQLLEDTKESKILYGKIVEEGKGSIRVRKGYIQWLREKTDLTEEAIQALAKDKEARDRFKEMSKDERDEYVQKSNNNAFRKERDEVRAKEKEKEKKGTVQQELGNTLLSETIQGNEVLLTLYNGTNAEKKKAVELAKRIVEVEKTASEQLEYQNNQLKQRQQYILKNLQVAKLLAEEEAQKEVESATGRTLESRQIQNDKLAKEAAYIRASEIGPIEDKIKAQEKLIDGVEREVELLERGLETYEDQVAEKEKQVEAMQRADELAMRESEYLDHDLKLMGYMEEKINETYNDRLESLTKVEQINQRIANQQRDQLGLADALSRGDVSAAAAAKQQMEQNSMQAAADQFRSQLEGSRDSQIASLTGAESGMTKDQITQRQRELEEQSYYTQLKIRDVEDEIYNLSMTIAQKQDEINNKLKSTRDYEDEISRLEGDILAIEDGRLAKIESITRENETQLTLGEWKKAQAAQTHDEKIAQANRENKVVNAQNELEVLGLKLMEDQGAQIKNNIDLMNGFGKATARAYRAARSGKFRSVDAPEVKRQSAKREEELRNMVDNMTFAPATSATASFNVPGSSVGAAAVNGIMNVTNNYMNNNVNVNAQGASADEVADIVIRRLDMRDNKSIGGA